MKKNVRLLAVFNFLTDFDLFNVVAIIYYSQVTESFTRGMSIFSVVFIASAIFEIPTGILSDYIGRKKTIILGAGASLTAAIVLALAQSYLGLIASAIFAGLARAFYSGNNDAFLYETLQSSGKEKKFQKYLGQVASLFQVAAALSALLGGVLASISFSLVLWLSVLPRIFKLLISFFFTEPKKYSPQSGNVFSHFLEATRMFLKNQKLRHLSVASILGFSIGEASYAFRSIFVHTLWPLWAVGVARVLSSLGAAVSFYFSGFINKKIGKKSTLVFGIALTRIINLIALGFPTILSPALMSSTSLLFGVNSTAREDLFQREFTRQQRATMSSLNALFGSLFFALASVGIGYLADNFGITTALITGQIILFAVPYIYWRFFRLEKKIKKALY